MDKMSYLDKQIEITLDQIRIIKQLFYCPMIPLDSNGNKDRNKEVFFLWYNNMAKKTHDLLIKQLALLIEAKIAIGFKGEYTHEQQ